MPGSKRLTSGPISTRRCSLSDVDFVLANRGAVSALNSATCSAVRKSLTMTMEGRVSVEQN